jgi:hypothetical protein
MSTPENTHAGHGHIENQAVVWNSDGDQVALFAPPHGSAFVVFTYADGRPRLCQLIPRQARELFENIAASWESGGQLDEKYGT